MRKKLKFALRKSEYIVEGMLLAGIVYAAFFAKMWRDRNEK